MKCPGGDLGNVEVTTPDGNVFLDATDFFVKFAQETQLVHVWGTYCDNGVQSIVEENEKPYSVVFDALM